MRLIDADALKTKAETIQTIDCWHMRTEEQAVLVEHIDNAPTIDVAPVRHGRWIEYGENKDGTHNMRCSKCGAGLKSKGHANSYYTKHKYRYCPNCGAKMDEEENVMAYAKDTPTNVRAYAKDTPTAVPIVRCKECMYSETDDMGFYYCVHDIIGGYGVTFDANMFCSYGERKDDE